MTEARHTNQCNKAKLALYNPLLNFYELFKELYVSNKTEYFSYKMGMAYMYQGI